MLSRFIGGSTILQAQARLQSTPYLPIYDRAKEASRTLAEGQQYVRDIVEDCNSVQQLQLQQQHINKGSSMFAIKYSSFYPKKHPYSNRARISRLAYTLYRMKEAGVKRVLIDAEDDELHEIEQEVMSKLIPVFNKNDVFIYKTYQMYRKDGLQTLIQDLHTYPNLGVKLVRGAYKHIDEDSGKLFANKSDTDHTYNAAIDHVVRSMRTTHKVTSQQTNTLELLVATHNDTSIEIAVQHIIKNPDELMGRIAFGQLLGMNDLASARLANAGFKVYKYMPYGPFHETFPYLTRRLLENYEMLRYVL